MKQPLRNAISSSLVVALGVIITYHLVLLSIQGAVVIVEPNVFARFAETAMGILIIVFGFERLARI